MTGIVAQISISSGGVPNYAVAEGNLTLAGITGDGWRHSFHGGPKRAILLITAETVYQLIAEGFPLFYGALAENITTLGLDRRLLRPGQRLRAGQSLIELTQLRLPCDTISVYGSGIQAAIFDARSMAGDPASPVWGMSGFYASVVEPGILRPGDPIGLLS